MMNLITVAALASMPSYTIQADAQEMFDYHRTAQPTAAPPAAVPSLATAQEVDARVQMLVSEVKRTARNLRAVVPNTAGDLLPDAEIDVALRMPRGPVVRRKGTLRLVKSRTSVVSPTAEELAHLFLGDGANGG